MIPAFGGLALCDALIARGISLAPH